MSAIAITFQQTVDKANTWISELMDELAEISDAVEPHEILLVGDAMTGQEAVNVAQGFDEPLATR